MTSSKPRAALTDDGLDLEHELKIYLDTLHELGPEYTDDLAASFVKKVDRLIDERVDERLAERGGRSARLDHHEHRRAAREQHYHGPWMLIPILALGIPLTAVAGGTAGTLGVVVVWAAILIIGFGWLTSRRQES